MEFVASFLNDNLKPSVPSIIFLELYSVSFSNAYFLWRMLDTGTHFNRESLVRTQTGH